MNGALGAAGRAAMRVSAWIVLGLVLASGLAGAENLRSGWSLEIPERIGLVPSTSGTLPIEVTLDRGLSVSKDAAIIVDLAPDAAISVKRRRLGRADAVDPDAPAPRFAVVVRGDNTGDYTMRVRVRFWLCGTRACKPVEARRNVAISVAATAPAPSPPADAGVR